MAQPTNRRLVTEAAQTARLSTLEYDSGWRDITDLIAETSRPVSGTLLLQRVAWEVHLDFGTLVYESGANSIELGGGVALLPPGLRPARTIDLPFPRRLSEASAGSLRIDPSGRAWLYQVRGGPSYGIRGLLSFPTPNPIPATQPGDPA